MAFTYDPSKIAFLAGGVRITNLSKDTMIAISYNGPSASHRTPVDGEGVFSVMRDRKATVTVTAEPNSNAHAIFSALHLKMQLTGGGMFPVAVINYNTPDGVATFVGTAVVSQMPNTTYGAEAQATDWELLVEVSVHVEAALEAPSIL